MCVYVKQMMKCVETRPRGYKTQKKHNDWLLADRCPQVANHCALF